MSHQTIDAIATVLHLLHVPAAEQASILDTIATKEYVHINLIQLLVRVETILLECTQIEASERTSFQVLQHRLEMLCDELASHSLHLSPQ